MEGRATYTLGEEVFISEDNTALDAQKQVFKQALNYTSYKFSNIPDLLYTFKAKLANNGQYFWLKENPPYLQTCRILLKELATQNKVSIVLRVTSSRFEIGSLLVPCCAFQGS